MRSFLRSFFGRIAAAFVLALCAAVGFGPDVWAQRVMAADATILFILKAAFLLLGVATLCVLIWAWRVRALQELAEESPSILNRHARLLQTPDGVVLPYHPTDSASWKPIFDDFSPEDREEFVDYRKLIQNGFADAERQVNGTFRITARRQR